MGLAGLDDLPPLAPHLPEVEELEAELSALAAPAVAVVPDAAADAGPADDPTQDPRARTHQTSTPDQTRHQTHAAPTGQDEEVRA